ncbi:hypothetical protein Hdeb2414_s0007g00240711 [Helianthus debilis subsp. tardiflorus]
MFARTLMSPITDLTCLTASIMFPEISCFSFRPNHRSTFTNPPQCLSQIPTPTHKRNPKIMLINMILIIRQRQNLTLINIIHTNRFQNLRLNEMPYPRLRHHRNRNRLLNLLNQLRIAHPCNAALRADVRRNSLQRHDSTRPSFFRHTRLFGVHDVHNYAASEHLSEADLDGVR